MAGGKAPWYDHFVTTTGETPLLPPHHPGPLPLSDFPLDVSIDTRVVEDPFRRWLEANGISMDRIVMWPELKIDGDIILVESFSFTGGSHTTFYDQGHTRLLPYPLRVAPPRGLVEAYQYQRGRALADRALDRLGRAGATIIRLEGGDTALFVAMDRLDTNVAAGLVNHLERVLPGVNIVMLSGVDTIMHQKRQS